MRNHQRRGQADHVLVGLFTENSRRHHAFTDWAGRDREVDSDEKPDTPDFLNGGVDNSPKLIQEPSPEPPRILNKPIIFNDPESSACNCTSERVASEGATVAAGLEHSEDFGTRNHGRYRIEATRKGLVSDHLKT